eukprot:TRINITY_DN68051_c3_g1_i1.p1 TRINITY_DN68051_c3_g1~~TRINITY_DN68051_c3_g1_i1.p1  ORF type:complete len:245 (+),score=59.57 TRINITY_DN68051_c3_g1_i1:272-1006(+)
MVPPFTWYKDVHNPDDKITDKELQEILEDDQKICGLTEQGFDEAELDYLGYMDLNECSVVTNTLLTEMGFVEIPTGWFGPKFTKVDEDNSGQISLKQYISFLKDVLRLHLSENQAELETEVAPFRLPTPVPSPRDEDKSTPALEGVDDCSDSESDTDNKPTKDKDPTSETEGSEKGTSNDDQVDDAASSASSEPPPPKWLLDSSEKIPPVTPPTAEPTDVVESTTPPPAKKQPSWLAQDEEAAP